MSKEIRYLLQGLAVGAFVMFCLRPASKPESIQGADDAVELKSMASNNNAITGYDMPSQISFAGEEVPLDRIDVRERLDREIQVNAFWHSNSVLLIKRANKWLPTIDSILIAQDVPSDFKYLAVAESGLQNVISPARAVGFWQFMKGTAKDFGLRVNDQVDERYDPVLSTVAASAYLKKAHKKFGSWTKVAVAYNMGMKGAYDVIQNQKANTYYDMNVSEEPARYVFRIIALKTLLESPEKFNFEVNKEDLYQLPKTRKIVLINSVEDWPSFAESHDMSFYELKQLNPWIRDYKLSMRRGEEFIVSVLTED